jgi:hypothetical protein
MSGGFAATDSGPGGNWTSITIGLGNSVFNGGLVVKGLVSLQGDTEITNHKLQTFVQTQATSINANATITFEPSSLYDVSLIPGIYSVFFFIYTQDTTDLINTLSATMNIGSEANTCFVSCYDPDLAQITGTPNVSDSITFKNLSAIPIYVYMSCAYIGSTEALAVTR